VTTSTVPDDSSDSNARTKRNIFEDPAIAEATKDDPFALFVAQHWRTILTILVAVGLGLIAFNRFRVTADEKRASATLLFQNIRESYAQLVTKDEELAKTQRTVTEKNGNEKEDAQKKVAGLQDEIKKIKDRTHLMIQSLDSPAPFDSLAIVYGGLLAARAGDYESARKAMTQTPWEMIGKPGSPDRFLAEMSVLGLSKVLVDAPAEASVQDAAKNALLNLAERGEFAAVAAIGVLSAITEQPEEKAKLSPLIENLRTKFPSQVKFIEDAVGTSPTER